LPGESGQRTLCSCPPKGHMWYKVNNAGAFVIQFVCLGGI